LKKIEDEDWFKKNCTIPFKPWVWAIWDTNRSGPPIEIVSYPWWDEASLEWLVKARRKVGDPTSLDTIFARHWVTIEPEKHEFAKRERVPYGDNPTAFYFRDELPA